MEEGDHEAIRSVSKEAKWNGSGATDAGLAH